MRVLIAEDDPVSRHILTTRLTHWNYEVEVTSTGNEALEQLQKENAPSLAILDWMMPEMDGIEVCRKVREKPTPLPIYIIMLTAKDQTEDLIEGFKAGADDYIRKPFEKEELHARIDVGARTIKLQMDLADRIKELEESRSTIKDLQGLLPICSYCKKIRDDKNYWKQIDQYLMEETEAQLTHSICPDCYDMVMKTEIEPLKQEKRMKDSS